MADIDLPIYRRDKSEPKEIEPNIPIIQPNPAQNDCELPKCGKRQTTVAEIADDSIITPKMQEDIDSA